MNLPSFEKPFRGTCGSDVREQIFVEELQRNARTSKFKNLYTSLVGFFHSSPYMQKSKLHWRHWWRSINRFIRGTCHAMEEKGFSTTKGILHSIQISIIRSVNRNNLFPWRSLYRSESEREGNPQIYCSVRKGPGPIPSCLRALEKVVQGIPNQTIWTFPLLNQWWIVCSTSFNKTLWEGKMQVSIGNASKPTFLKAVVIRAVPAKISRQKRLGKLLKEKTSSHEASLTDPATAGHLETLSLNWSRPMCSSLNCLDGVSTRAAGPCRFWHISSHFDLSPNGLCSWLPGDLWSRCKGLGMPHRGATDKGAIDLPPTAFPLLWIPFCILPCWNWKSDRPLNWLPWPSSAKTLPPKPSLDCPSSAKCRRHRPCLELLSRSLWQWQWPPETVTLLLESAPQCSELPRTVLPLVSGKGRMLPWPSKPYPFFADVTWALTYRTSESLELEACFEPACTCASPLKLACCGAGTSSTLSEKTPRRPVFSRPLQEPSCRGTTHPCSLQAPCLPLRFSEARIGRSPSRRPLTDDSSPHTDSGFRCSHFSTPAPSTFLTEPCFQLPPPTLWLGLSDVFLLKTWPCHLNCPSKLEHSSCCHSWPLLSLKGSSKSLLLTLCWGELDSKFSFATDHCEALSDLEVEPEPGWMCPLDGASATFTSDLTQRGLSTIPHAKHIAEIRCSTRKRSKEWALPFATAKQSAKLSNKHKCRLFLCELDLEKRRTAIRSALASFKVMCSLVCSHLPILTVLHSEGSIKESGISGKSSSAIYSSNSSFTTKPPETVLTSDRTSQPSDLSRGFHWEAGRRLKRQRSIHLPCLRTVSILLCLSQTPNPIGEASVQVIMLDHSFLISESKRGTSPAKVKHSSLSEACNLRGLQPLATKSYSLRKTAIPLLFNTQTTIEWPNNRCIVLVLTTHHAAHSKAKIKCHILFLVGFTKPFSPSMTPPKVSNTVQASTCSCNWKPMEERLEAIASLATWHRSPLVHRLWILSQYGTIHTSSFAKEGGGCPSKKRHFSSFPKAPKAIWVCRCWTKKNDQLKPMGSTLITGTFIPPRPLKAPLVICRTSETNVPLQTKKLLQSRLHVDSVKAVLDVCTSCI